MISLSGQYPTFVLTPEEMGSVTSQIAKYMWTSVDKNFEAGGRPTWQALKAGGPSMLRKSGALRNSISMSSGENFAEVEVGSGIPYARIHQFGGTINHPGSDKFQAFMSGGQMVFSHGTKPHTIVMPQRKYLMFQDEDVEHIKSMVPGMLVKFIDAKKEKI